MLPVETIRAFDRYLRDRELELQAVIVGGAALGLLGLTERQTRDVDVLIPDLSTAMLDASRSFARQQRKAGFHLDDDWLNNGRSSLKELLPDGWDGRLQVVFSGEAITMSTLGRSDLLRTKLFALCDRGIDLRDCLALAPTEDGLSDVESWVAYQDTNPMWPEHVRATLDDLRRRLGHGVS